MKSRKETLKELVVDRMNLDIEPASIADDTTLFGDDDDSLGLDSIDALDLVVGVYEEFDVEIKEDDMHVFENINTLERFIAEKSATAVAV